MCDLGISSLEQDIKEGENPVFDLEFTAHDLCSKSRAGRDSYSKWVVRFI